MSQKNEAGKCPMEFIEVLKFLESYPYDLKLTTPLARALCEKFGTGNADKKDGTLEEVIIKHLIKWITEDGQDMGIGTLRRKELAQAIRRFYQEEIMGMVKDKEYFLNSITHNDLELAKIQSRSMELGYAKAITDIIQVFNLEIDLGGESKE